jgi:hypothetical protein
MSLKGNRCVALPAAATRPVCGRVCGKGGCVCVGGGGGMGSGLVTDLGIARGDGRDERRVEAAREQHAPRHVGHHALVHLIGDWVTAAVPRGRSLRSILALPQRRIANDHRRNGRTAAAAAMDDDAMRSRSKMAQHSGQQRCAAERRPTDMSARWLSEALRRGPYGRYGIHEAGAQLGVVELARRHGALVVPRRRVPARRSQPL